MSGICAIAQTPGHPVDRELLQAMTDYMAFRGPDGQNQWVGGHVGLGHAWFRTDPFTPPVKQPATLDGKVWITADARIDDRQALTLQLKSAGRQVKQDADDAVMILHAYLAWDTACLDRLLGDFCFVIWDENKQRLFCARDHFGIKPLFYARQGTTLVVSNTLNTIRLHPSVSDELNDLAVADFLLFGEGQEPDNSIFADIHRLAAGHALAWTAQDGLRIWRYWQMPEAFDPLGLRPREYVEAFTERFEQAVSDRLRTTQIGVELSGGMDSTSVAALASRLLQRKGRPFRLQGITCVYDRLIPDTERHFVSLAAEHLGISTRFIVGEDYALLQPPEDGWHPPEPVDTLQPRLYADIAHQAARLSRVWLTGWDGDALLSESIRPHLALLRAQRRYGALAMSLISFAWTHGHLIPWRSLAGGRQAAPKPVEYGFPHWINPALEHRLGLRERWHRLQHWPRSRHPTRPYALTVYKAMAANGRAFDAYDAGFSGQPTEYRHPMMDLRLIDFCMALPPQPWVVKKYILREALKGALPDAILRRPKSALAGFPEHALLKRDAAQLTRYEVSENISNYVTFSGKFPPKSDSTELLEPLPSDLRPQMLSDWLTGLDT